MTSLSSLYMHYMYLNSQPEHSNPSDCTHRQDLTRKNMRGCITLRESFIKVPSFRNTCHRGTST